MCHIFFLYYDHEIPYEVEEVTYFKDDIRLLGAYEDEAEAEAALDRAKKWPEFSSTSKDLHIYRYDLGETFWEEGFFTWVPEGN